MRCHPRLECVCRYTMFAVAQRRDSRGGEFPQDHTVTLYGRLPGGRPMHIQLEIDFTSASTGNAVHILAARELIRDLEEGTSFLHTPYPMCYAPSLELVLDTDCASLVVAFCNDPAQSWPPVPDPALVNAEIERVGVQFGVASSQTSFVAVEERSETMKILEAPQRREVSAVGQPKAADPRPATGLPSPGPSKVVESRASAHPAAHHPGRGGARQAKKQLAPAPAPPSSMMMMMALPQAAAAELCDEGESDELRTSVWSPFAAAPARLTISASPRSFPSFSPPANPSCSRRPTSPC